MVVGQEKLPGDMPAALAMFIRLLSPAGICTEGVESEPAAAAVAACSAQIPATPFFTTFDGLSGEDAGPELQEWAANPDRASITIMPTIFIINRARIARTGT